MNINKTEFSVQNQPGNMDPHPTPFPGTGTGTRTSHSRKSKTQRKCLEAPKTHVKETTLINREKRVFGTSRNPNGVIPAAKTLVGVAERAKTKALLVVPLKSANPEFSKKTPIHNGDNIKKKTVVFKENVEVPADVVSGARTPLRSPFLVRPRALSTPFLSAEKCSKCRFDKLETSSYWLAQIKLAESVAKHFASALFFNLALQCRAEPFHNIKVELKKYLARHEDLAIEEEWKALSIGYGFLKEERKSSCKEVNEKESKTELTKKISLEEEEEEDHEINNANDQASGW